jgi:hypothetical protein
LSFGIFILCGILGAKRGTEERIIPRSIDADDSDVEAKSDDERFIFLRINVLVVVADE